MGSYSEYPEENVNIDYGVQNPAYSMMGSEHLMPPNYTPSGRGWASGSHVPKATPLFLEQDPNYSGGQVTYHGAYQLRPAISPDSKSSLHSVSMPIAIHGTPLPPLPTGGTDRVLPHPGTRTPLPNHYVRSAASAQHGYHAYEGMISSINSAKPSTTNAVSATGSIPTDTYLAYSGSSPESLASSAQTAYSTQQLSQQQADLYAANSESLYHTAADSSESCYGPSSEKRQSNSSQDQDGAPSSISSGTLSSGQSYTPFNNHGLTYPPPPMDMPAPTPIRQHPALPSRDSSA